MGLFHLFFGGGNRSYNRRNNAMHDEYRQALREMRKLKSKLYRTVRTVVIFVTALTTALFVLSFLVKDLRHVWLYKMVFVLYALCAGGGMTLPWITEFERDRRKAAKGEAVASWRKFVVFAFWGLTAICTLLWIISVFIISDEAIALVEDQELDLSGTSTMLRISVIVTLQVAVGSVIAASTMRYGKKYLGLRVVIYATLAYLDFWLSWFVGGTTVPKLSGKVFFAPIHVTGLWVIAILAAVALLTAGGIFGAQARRKEIELFMKGDVEALTEGDVDLIDSTATHSWGKKETPAPAAPSAPAGKDPEQQLAKIKDLLDKGLITEEEYHAKRQDIIDKM